MEPFRPVKQSILDVELSDLHCEMSLAIEAVTISLDKFMSLFVFHKVSVGEKKKAAIFVPSKNPLETCDKLHLGLYML